MKDRSLIRFLPLIICVLPLIWLTKAASSNTSPNILLITIDTLRLANVGCYGNTIARTPNIDKLASKGVIFDRYYTTANCTGPSHLSLLSGKLPSSLGIYDNQKYDVQAKTKILPVYLRQLGYKTFGVPAVFFFNKEWLSGFGSLFDSFIAPRDGEFRAEQVSSAFKKFVPELQKQKFFCWLHFYDPHVPYDPPPDYKRMFDADAMGGQLVQNVGATINTSWMKSHGVSRTWQARARYRGEVAYTDFQIGEVLKTLKENSLDKNTIVIVVADHGELLGSHGYFYTHYTLYEETIHVPFIVYGENFSRRRVSQFVSGLDIAPTILEIAGATTIPDDMEGISAVPFLKGNDPERDRFIYAQAAENLSVAVFKPPFKMIFNTPASEIPQSRELYQILQDPYERRNLLSQHPQVATLLEDHAKRFSFEPRLEQNTVSITEHQKEQLMALGYVQE